jgi:hypothetical protein
MTCKHIFAALFRIGAMNAELYAKEHDLDAGRNIPLAPRQRSQKRKKRDDDVEVQEPPQIQDAVGTAAKGSQKKNGKVNSDSEGSEN